MNYFEIGIFQILIDGDCVSRHSLLSITEGVSLVNEEFHKFDLSSKNYSIEKGVFLDKNFIAKIPPSEKIDEISELGFSQNWTGFLKANGIFDYQIKISIYLHEISYEILGKKILV